VSTRLREKRSERTVLQKPNAPHVVFFATCPMQPQWRLAASIRWLHHSAVSQHKSSFPLIVDLIRSRTQHLGTVEAANEKEAIEAATKLFNIEPARRNRITVTKISNREKP
jgi:hypothetical protein